MLKYGYLKVIWLYVKVLSIYSQWIKLPFEASQWLDRSNLNINLELSSRHLVGELVVTPHLWLPLLTFSSKMFVTRRIVRIIMSSSFLLKYCMGKAISNIMSSPSLVLKYRATIS